jgi:hypothetical protein
MDTLKNTTVVVFSGLAYSGKSFWLPRITSIFPGVSVVQMDKTRIRVFGEKVLTRTGHLFKNEAVRQEAKEVIVANRPKYLFTEAVMLTRENHQLPFLEMVRSSQSYVQAIDREEAEQDGCELECKPKVKLLVILFYCDLCTVGRRIEERRQAITFEGGRDGAYVVEWAEWVNQIKQFEIPTDYSPLYVNTSDRPEKDIENEILSFLSDGVHSLVSEVMEQRRAEFEGILSEGRCLNPDLLENK